MKKITFLFLLLVSIFTIKAQTVSITQEVGWLETAYVKWSTVSGVDSYNVYYTGMGITDKKIDTQLIRNYGGEYRADILGLTAGVYTIKVVPVVGGIEGTPAVSNPITVLSHDRNGFAFNGGRVPGAYKADGTLKDNAVVIYITQNTKNTVSLNVTGATNNPCVGLQTILDGFKKGKDNRPLAIRLIGNITDLNYMLGGDIVIENNNNASSYITFEGVGSDAYANGWGLRIKNATNIEVRNLGFMLTDASEGDNVGLQQNNDYVWVHNNDLFYGSAGGDADQVKGDGAMDSKKSNYVTMSYNHFWDTGKSNLLGLSEGANPGYITYHHNWYDHSDSRHPRVRYYSAHIYNNYFDGVSKYGSGSTLGSSLFLEGNFFRNCKYPMLTSRQGTDVYGGAVGTFSGEDGGFIKAFNNVMSGQTRFVAYDALNYPVEFDAYVATSRGEVIPNTIKSKAGANIYNNFDTNTSLYVNSLTVDDPTIARDKVMQYAGRVSKGDLSWAFNNAVDDTSSSVNTGLKALLTGYVSSLVFVQGENSTTASTQTLSIPSNNDQIVTTGAAISDMVFTWGGSATDANVSGLPASGINFVKNATTKTITISGTPTADVSFTVITSGTNGTPVSGTGNITVSSEPITPVGDQIHNFTASGVSSSFYTISGNLSTTKGTVSYEGLTLTQCLKIETSTNIAYTTSQASTLTLVFVESAPTIKVDGVSYTGSGGIITISVPAGSHTITKQNTANLFYMKTVFSTLGINEVKGGTDVKIYPNPVLRELNFRKSNGSVIQKINIVNVNGQILKTLSGDIESIDLSNLKSGLYFINILTNKGIEVHKIIKK